jgi:hypothetical protein
MRFDLAMVDLDQAIVQQVLERDPDGRRLANGGSEPSGGDDPWSGDTMGEINRLLNSRGDAVRPAFGMIGVVDQDPAEWARRYLGVRDLDARVRVHRAAIGKALIFLRHQCTYDDFADAVRKTPAANPKGR